jgi:hypothetical protein
MAKGMNRRRFLAQMAGAGLAAPLVISERVAAQTGPPPPSNVRLVSSPPPSSPPPSGSGTANRQLLGGWRLAMQGEPQGAIAIDFNSMRLWISGAGGGVQQFNLPAMNSGDPNGWPRLSPGPSIARWWPGTLSGAQGVYPNGLVFWQNKLWVAVRGFYTVEPSATMPMTIYAQDGQTIATNLPQQKFSGFVKRGPGLDPLLGAGGYESGQGSQSGPSLATLSGQRLIEYQWPGMPGSNLEYWNQRAPRDTNYYPSDHGDTTRTDYWVAWNPRTVNGQLQGRWASDYVFGGGLALSDGITYWPWQGTGPLDYVNQNPTFAFDGKTQTSQYRYDANTYQFISFAKLQDTGRFPVKGQELGPDGKVYLSVINPWWDSGQNMTDVAIKVYG